MKKEYSKDILDEIDTISDDIKKSFLQIIKENVKISTINIVGRIKLSYNDENGIELVKESLKEALKVIKKPKETRNLSISYLAAPFYRLEIISKDYLDAENILSDALEVIEGKANK